MSDLYEKLVSEGRQQEAEIERITIGILAAILSLHYYEESHDEKRIAWGLEDAQALWRKLNEGSR